MNDNDKKQFAEILAMAAEATGYSITDTTYKTYWALLKDKMDIQQFNDSVQGHLFDPNDGMFFPKPANLIKQLTGTSKQIEQSLQAKAELAWQAVEGEIRAVGSYGSPRIDDGLALAAIKALGGWVHICMITTDKMTWLRKEFIASYLNYENTPVELLPESLPGRIQIENAKKKGDGQGMKSIGNIMKNLQQK